MSRDKKTRILITDFKLGREFGGAEFVAKTLYDGLKKHYNISYFGFDIGINEKSKHMGTPTSNFISKVYNSKLFRYFMKNMFYRSKTWRGVVFFLNELRRKITLKEGEIYTDLVISNSPYDYSILSGKNKFKVHISKGIIFVKHGVYSDLGYPYPDNLIKDKPFKIVALNSSDYSNLSKLYGRENVALIHNGLDIDVNINLTKDDLNYLSSIDINPDNKVILSLGRLEDTQKGFSFGIKAMALLKDKYPNLIYVVAGKGPDMDMYRKLISKYGLDNKVKLLGYVTDEQKYSLFRRADIILFPSAAETFGLATVEAMFFGKPIITTKNEGSIDIIKDGYNGFFAERNEKDIADKVEKILSLDMNKLAKIKRNSLSTIKLFSIEKMIKSYKSVIKELAK